MSVAPVASEPRSFLDTCFVEGNSEQVLRERRIKRRALLVSIVLQVLIVAALVLFPLLSKGENIASRVLIMPTVPYARAGNPDRPRNPRRPQQNRPTVCRFCPPHWIPKQIVMSDPTPPLLPPDGNVDDSDISRYGSPNGSRDGIADSSRESGPPPPVEKQKTNEPPQRIHIGTIEPAMLIHRVEPTYPPLGRQLRREGRVELQALISTDGTIRSLEVISGDPLFIRSALDAVREWRYRPTILNGQTVEVDTHITVVYTLTH